MTMTVAAYMRERNRKIPPLAKGYKYISTKRYAELTDDTPEHVRLLCLSGCLEGAYKVGNRWKIPIEA